MVHSQYMVLAYVIILDIKIQITEQMKMAYKVEIRPKAKLKKKWNMQI